MGRTMKTTKKQIIEWGRANIDECDYGVDHLEMDTHCWRCGHETTTERCHVIPYALGGPDTPSNYRLLCNPCHHEAPNVNDYDAMDAWIRDTCVAYYNTFWHYRKAIDQAFEESTIHFGHRTRNHSTLRWVMNRFLELLFHNDKLPYKKRFKVFNKEVANRISCDLYLAGFSKDKTNRLEVA